MRNLKQGVMTIDGQQIIDGDGLSRGPARSLNVKPPYYIGGLPQDTGKLASRNLMVRLRQLQISTFDFCV